MNRYEEPESSSLLSLVNVSANYAQVPALLDISIEVAVGEFVVLLGPNGAGKTTTLRTVSGLVRLGSGNIRFQGRDIGNLRPNRIAHLGIAHVPEGRQVFPEHTVQENLQLGAFPLRRDKDLMAQTRDEVYSLFPRLEERAGQEAGTLSGGEAQMLAIARALMSRPRLLMLDEPSLGLAPQLVVEMFEYLDRLHSEQNLTLLVVEQAASIALRYAQRGYVLETGRVALQGSAEALSADPKVQRVYLGGEVSSE